MSLTTASECPTEMAVLKSRDYQSRAVGQPGERRDPTLKTTKCLRLFVLYHFLSVLPSITRKTIHTRSPWSTPLGVPRGRCRKGSRTESVSRGVCWVKKEGARLGRANGGAPRGEIRNVLCREAFWFPRRWGLGLERRNKRSWTAKVRNSDNRRGGSGNTSPLILIHLNLMPVRLLS